MKALRFYDKGDIRLDDVLAPTCGKDEVRLKVAYCGICGTDLHEYHAGPIFPPAKGQPNKHTGAELPVILGHEFSGTIVEVGDEVSGFAVGQNVAVNPALDDRHHGQVACDLCLTGRTNLCKRSTFYGLNAHGGGFAEEIVVKSYALVPLPQNVPLKLGALAEPLAVASHMVRTSGFQKGQTVLVLGAGPIGCALTFLLRVGGARKIVVSEVSPSRASQASGLGADRVVNPLGQVANEAGSSSSTKQQDIVRDVVDEATGGGVDIAFDACGIQSTLDTAIACTKPGGTIFNVAIHDKALKIHLNDLTIYEKKIMGGICYTAEDFGNVIEVLSTRGEEAGRLITSVVPLEDVIDGGFHELINNTANHVKILIAARSE